MNTELRKALESFVEDQQKERLVGRKKIIMYLSLLFVVSFCHLAYGQEKNQTTLEDAPKNQSSIDDQPEERQLFRAAKTLDCAKLVPTNAPESLLPMVSAQINRACSEALFMGVDHKEIDLILTAAKPKMVFLVGGVPCKDQELGDIACLIGKPEGVTMYINLNTPYMLDAIHHEMLHLLIIGKIPHDKHHEFMKFSGVGCQTYYLYPSKTMCADVERDLKNQL